MHGSGLHTGDTLLNDPAVQVIVSHVYPARLCVHVEPLATLAPSPQLDVAPDGVIDDEYVHGSGLHTGDMLLNDPGVHVIVSHVYPGRLCVHVEPLATLVPSPQLDVAPDGVIDDE